MKKISYNSPVILTFVILGLAAFLLNHFTDGWANSQLFSTYRSSFTDPLTYVRAIFFVFGHATVGEYTANMVMVLLVGPMLEEKYGSGNLLVMMAITAAATAVITAAFFPGKALMGASGVIFMFIMLSSFTAVRRGKIPLTLILAAVYYICGEMLDGLLLADHVAQLAHITGGLVGCLLGWMMSTK